MTWQNVVFAITVPTIQIVALVVLGLALRVDRRNKKGGAA